MSGSSVDKYNTFINGQTLYGDVVVAPRLGLSSVPVAVAPASHTPASQFIRSPTHHRAYHE
ncbi:hypothetical protein BGY98DRAFT_993631, partial [Russula aff. rugulosa BPL654]